MLARGTFDIPREIETLRDHYRWSQSELAKALGVSQGAVSDWERGQYPPSADVLIKLGNIASTGAATGFWMGAGLDMTRVLGTVGSLLSMHDVSATSEQLSKFPELLMAVEIGVSTAERILRLPTKAVLELAKSGKIKARRVGSTYTFDYGAVVDFSAAMRRKP
jgi:transcriptional regulator with XRE-family HTH domain